MGSLDCTKCQRNLPLVGFSFRNVSKNIRHTICKECHKQISLNHYHKNKSVYISRASLWEKDHLIQRRGITHSSYARKKGYLSCTCCTKEQLTLFLEKCPPKQHIDHIINSWEGGRHCLDNLQYLTKSEHNSKSGKELKLKRIHQERLRWLQDNM